MDEYSIRESKRRRTVTFNVGGKLFEVSVSLLLMFKDSILAQKGLKVIEIQSQDLGIVDDVDVDDGTGDEHQKNDKVHGESRNESFLSIHNTTRTNPPTIFLDRDSDRFQLCLDYMRDRRVYLPYHISREAVLHELDYYGIAKYGTVEQSDIDDSSTRKESLHCFRKNFEKFQQEMSEKITSSHRQIQRLQDEIYAMKLIHDCALRYAHSGRATNYIALDQNKDQHYHDIIARRDFSADTPGIGPIVAREFAKFGFSFERVDCRCVCFKVL